MEVTIKIPTHSTIIPVNDVKTKTELFIQLSRHAEKNATCIKNGVTYYTMYSYLKNDLVVIKGHKQDSFHELIGFNPTAGKRFNLERLLSAIINETSIVVPTEIDPQLDLLLNNGGTYPPLAFMDIPIIITHSTLTPLLANYSLADNLYLFYNNNYYYPARFYVADKTLFIEYVDSSNKY